MNSQIEQIKKFFEYELKRKLSEKARHIVDEYKILLNCFKFFDINNEGELDKKKWINGILKTGLSGFNEKDLDSLYDNYLTNNLDKMDYKDFCNYLYGRERIDPLSKSLKNKPTNLNDNSYNIINSKRKNFFNNNSIQNIDLNQYNRNYNKRQNKGFENASNKDTNINSFTNKNINKNYSNNILIGSNESKENDDIETLINKIKAKIHVDNGLIFYSFMKYIRINEEPTFQKVSFEDLSVTLQELHLNIASSEIHEFFNYLDSEKTGRIPTNDIINIIKGSLDDKRKEIINEVFSYIDNDKKGEISLTNLKNIYNAKNHPDVLDGNKTEQEIYNQFCFTIDVYIRVNKILNNSINNEQFIDYYSGISPSIKNDEKFKNILEKVWNVEQQKNKYKNKNYLNDNYNNTYGNSDIGINSIFLGVSRTQRPKYDYNYDYLEEFSKSSSNIANNNNRIIYKMNKNKEDNNNLNQKSNQNNFRNTDLNNQGRNSLNNYNKNSNQTVNYSNTIQISNPKNENKEQNKKYFNYESKVTNANKGIKIFKFKTYNPILNEYIQNDEESNNNPETNNSNIIPANILNRIQTPLNNAYFNNNYKQSNSQNNNIIKEEINTIKNNENNNIEVNINNNLEVKENNSNNSININQNDNLKESSSLILFRNLLISRGNKSIFRFQRMLSIYDRNHSGLISFDNFLTIFQAYYINFPISDIKSIFSLFDTTSKSLNNNNKNEYKDTSMFKIKYDNLLKSIIGKMSIKRQLLVKKVFDSFEKDNEGKIMTSDIKSKFNYKKHPDVLNGKNTPNEIYSDFLDFLETFREYNDNLKGGYSFNMSFEEFLDFYNEISMCIEDDDYFEYLLVNCWDLNEENKDENENNNNFDNQKKEIRDNNNINNYKNESNNFNNISNNYRRNSHYNNQNNNSNNKSIRMKIGSQIVNNN